jgi:hypothetical protein
MPIVVTVGVASPADIIADGYDSIKVYRSGYEDGAFLEVTTDSTRPVLSSTQVYYNFEDATGTSSSWYKTSYYNSTTTAEASLSAASKGIEVDLQYTDTTYPSEISMTSTDHYNVDKIRHYTGDNKKVIREYVSPQCTSGYQNVSEDNSTYKLGNRGWPLNIQKDNVSYTSLSEPYVTDYSYITFSGTEISTVSGILDIWYESFRHADREVLKVYNTTPNPPNVSSTAVTPEMLRLSAAISIIREELVQLMGETSGSFTLVGELSYNPEGLLRQKRGLLKDLQSDLDELIDEARSNNLIGVRID